jgi:OOP family OmpA-OmpF porin
VRGIFVRRGRGDPLPNSLKRAGLIALLLAAPLAAQAQGYFGAAIGSRDVNDACVGRVSCDSRDTSLHLFGGYQITDSFAFEAGYYDLGTVGSSDLTALDLSVVGTYPLGNRFELLGRLGFYRADVPGAGTSLGPLIGFGASYAMTRNAEFRLEWTRLAKVGPDTSARFDVDIISIGAIYRF